MKPDNSVTHRIKQARAGIKHREKDLGYDSVDISSFGLYQLESYNQHLYLELHGNQDSCELEHEEF